LARCFSRIEGGGYYCTVTLMMGLVCFDHQREHQYLLYSNVELRKHEDDKKVLMIILSSFEVGWL
jgi:hypothetical protein